MLGPLVKHKDDEQSAMKNRYHYMSVGVEVEAVQSYAVESRNDLHDNCCDLVVMR